MQTSCVAMGVGKVWTRGLLVEGVAAAVAANRGGKREYPWDTWGRLSGGRTGTKGLLPVV